VVIRDMSSSPADQAGQVQSAEAFEMGEDADLGDLAV